MIKRRFHKLDHGDRDASDPSSSSSDSEVEAEATEESEDDAIPEVKEDNESGSTTSGYQSEDSSANDIDVNSSAMARVLPPKAPTQANWTDTNTETFLKVCVEEIEAGNRLHSHFTKEGWNNRVDKFNKQTSCTYEKKQMKNKWDSLKQEFGMWARMVEKETSLGWDLVKQTVIAPDEWWVAKAKENPKYLLWKDQGPKHLSLIKRCFKDVVATGFFVYEPPADLTPHEQPNDQPVTNDPSHTTESEWDQHLDEINDAPTPSSNIQRKRKRKRMGKEKMDGATQKLQNSLDRIVQCIEAESNTTVAKTEDDRYSMPRCIALLKDVPGLEKGNPINAMAVRVFVNATNRQVFVSLMEHYPDLVVPWLSTFKTEDDYYSMPRCIALLKDVPRLEQGSPTIVMAVRVFFNATNRQVFVSLMEHDPDLVVPWLSTFTSDVVKNYK